MSTLPDIVIGSGPAGVSVAKARLALGKTVLMLDIGRTLEPDKAAARDALATKGPDQWGEDDIANYQAGQFDAPSGAIRKFGSDYAISSDPDIEQSPWFGLRSSGALGGLSNLWGASVLPSSERDIDDWPISAEALAPHYASVAEFLPVAGREDAISAVYPAFNMKGRSPLPLSPQAANLLERAASNQTNEFVVGAARSAVSNKCRACGMCLHGCPWGYIWTASDTVTELRAHDGFTYRNNAEVVEIAETAGRARAVLKGGEQVEGDRIFVAAGVLPTARIYLNSFAGITELTLLDSQHFFTPLLHHWRVDRDPEATPHHTLSSLFVAFEGSAAGRLVHSQLYTWNEQYKREMMENYGRKLPFASAIFEHLSKRLVVAQSFLHSDLSGQIRVSRASENKLSFDHILNDMTKDAVRSARRTLATGLRRLGLHSLGFAGRAGGPGSSFHVGGSLGMSNSPTMKRSDKIGRIKGLERVHAVDASVLPSIPASTITFTVMANAHRIGIETP